MKKLVLSVAVLASVLFASACPSTPTPPPPPAPISPKQPAAGDSWCTYTITKVTGGGALKVNDTICILCPTPPPAVCKTVASVTPAEGIVYDLAPPAAGAGCGLCPSANTYK